MTNERARLRGIEYERIFPRVHARALGGAMGVTAAAGMFLLTAVHVVAGPVGLPLYLLSNYFYGYDVSWLGACVGAVWAGAVGFAGGWLLGVVHNVTIHAWLVSVRVRTELSQRRNFIDHLR